ncbi:hypothetical protein [Brevibacillus daliensis]|uniref:hypothetical protein n=1 Tax=Brevibacillus daliensis TaxID=2892995 RepID=UPI001E4AC163|nr:hypothetical protein [Brevibacillus daliensis]
MTNPSSVLHKSTFMQSLETVKILQNNELDSYRIVKDRNNGLHYLHYHTHHISLMAGGIREEYDNFLPLDDGEVMAILLDENTIYQFPEHWQRQYFRGGQDDRLMLFDPTESFADSDGAEEELALLETFLSYKKQFEEATDKEAYTKEYFKKLEELQKQKKN